jgi:diguanylate cyclase (GGDEF)-like protein/PAS domain S-box-containing protein
MSNAGFVSLQGLAIAIELVAAVLFMSAPLAIAIHRRCRPEAPEPALLWLAGGFVGLVGVGYAVDLAGQLLSADRTIAQGLKLLTIVTAVAAAGFMFPIARRLQSLPSRRALEKANRALTTQVEQVQRANEVAALSEARYRLLIDTATEGILMLDRFGRITFANSRLAEMLGCPAPALKGRTIIDCVPTADRPGMIDALARHRQGVAERRAGQLLHADGRPIPVQFSISPMRDRGEVSGMLGVVTDQSEQAGARAALQTLADELEARVARRTESYRSVADQLARTLDLSRRQARTYGLLQTMSDMLQACTSPLEGARVAAQFAQALFDADAGTIYVTEDDEALQRPGSPATAFRALFNWGPPSESDEQMRVEDCWSLRKSMPYPQSAEEDALRCKHLRLGPTRHSLCLPLQAQARVVGAINLRAAHPMIVADQEAGEQRLKLAQLFAASTAQFLANLTLRQRLEEQSLRDPLTGLFNRRYFNEHLSIEFQRALRAKSPLALMMIDIDHFKRINDRFGHETGDRVLKAVAEVLSHNARAGDIVCRWGGEEFLLLMPGSSGQVARRRGDDIRNRVRDQVEVVGGTRVSVSIGVATYPEHACDPDGLIEVSDRALYAAKGAGRNRVTLAVAGI